MRGKIIFILLFLILILTSCDLPSTDDTKQEVNLTKTELATIYSEAADFMLDISNGSSRIVRTGYVESQNYSTLSSTVALIKLIALLYETDSFIISDEFVQFKLTISNNVIDMAFLNEENVEKNKLTATLIYTVDSEFNFEEAMFLHFDVDYNFETKEILGFEVRTTFAKEVNNHFKYENNKYYEYDPFVLSDEEINNKTLGLLDKYGDKVLNSIVIDADYGNEYAAAMLYAFGE